MSYAHIWSYDPRVKDQLQAVQHADEIDGSLTITYAHIWPSAARLWSSDTQAVQHADEKEKLGKEISQHERDKADMRRHQKNLEMSHEQLAQA